MLKSFQLQQGGGAKCPDPMTRGSAPGPRWGICPQTPVIGSHSPCFLAPARVKIPGTNWILEPLPLPGKIAMVAHGMMAVANPNLHVVAKCDLGGYCYFQ